MLPARARAADAPSSGERQVALPPLPYPYNALEPVIDTATMKLHHDKHLATYVTKLNAALASIGGGAPAAYPAILASLDGIADGAQRVQVRNNGGGVANHVQFFESLRAPRRNNRPSGGGRLAAAIDATFGSFEQFQGQFAAAARSLFGSGWVWLYRVNNDDDGGRRAGELAIGQFANQDSPLMMTKSERGVRGGGGGGAPPTPILGVDCWEHAYYLKYGPKRGEYVDAWWSVVNWDAVERVYETRA